MEDLFCDTKLEDTVLGECLIDDVFNTLREYCVVEEYFTQEPARQLFRVMQRLSEEGAGIDLVSVGAKLRENGSGSLLQYATYTTSLVYNSAHIKSHVQSLEALYYKREVNNLGMQIVESTNTMKQEELVEKVRYITDSIREKKHGVEAKHVSAVLPKARKEYERRIEQRSKGMTGGVTTGLKKLDDMTGGWEDNRLTVLAGRPGMGKTAVAIHFAISAARSGVKVLVQSLEMSEVEIVDRMICAVSFMDSYKYKHGIIGNEELMELENAEKELEMLPIYIDDEPIQSASYIWASAKRMQTRGECGLLIVDYLQLVDMGDGASRQFSKEQMVSKASREFKLMAKDLGIPVILLSQLNRAVEGRSDKRPELSDLRDSGSIEQDADNVIFVYRPEYYEEEARQGVYRDDGELLIRKQRNGPLGSVPFTYNPAMTHIMDAGSRIVETEQTDDTGAFPY